MALPNFHTARVRNPNEFEKDSIKTKSVPNSDGIMILIGTVKGQKASSTQSYRFPKDNYSVSEAKQWLEDKGVTAILFEPASSELEFEAIYTQVVAETSKVFIYGGVGDKIDGDQIAQEIRYLDGLKEVDLIEVRINSNGGLVTEGLSVVSSILNAETEIHTFNDGIAASMAGIILLTGDTVHMADYGQLMLHEPSIGRETIDTTQDEKTRNALIAINSMLSQLIMNRTNKSQEDVDALLKSETWYTAKQAKRNGFIDKIIRFNRKAEFTSLSTDDILNKIAAEFKSNNNNQKQIKMDNILNHFGLTEGTEEEVIAKIKEVEADKATLENKVNDATTNLDSVTNEKTQLEADKDALTTEKEELTNTVASLNKELATEVVDKAIAEGKFQLKDREDLLVKAEADISNFRELTKLVANQAPVSIVAQLEETKDEDGKYDGKTLRELEKTNSKLVQKLINEEPAVYAKLYKAEYGVEPKN